MAPPSLADHEDREQTFRFTATNCGEQTVELRRDCIMVASIIIEDWQSLHYVANRTSNSYMAYICTGDFMEKSRAKEQVFYLPT
jgi:hypothetical protein